MTRGPSRGSYRESRDWIQAMRRSLCPQPLPFAEVLWSHTCKIMGPEHVTRSAPKTREPSACPWKDTGRGRALVLGGGWGVPGVWAGAPVGTGAQNQTPWVLGRLSHRRPGRPGPTPAPLCAGLPTRVLYGSPLRLRAAPNQSGQRRNLRAFLFGPGAGSRELGQACPPVSPSAPHSPIQQARSGR